MNCPKCGSKMTQLFISWVCDYCDSQKPQGDSQNCCNSGKNCSSCTSCPSSAQQGAISAGSSMSSGYNSLTSYYNNLVPPPPSPTDWWMQLWTNSLSITQPTAADGLKALKDPDSLFRNPAKMTVLVTPDPSDSNYRECRVIDSLVLSAIGNKARIAATEMDRFEQFFPVFVGPPATTGNTIDGPSIWMFP